MILFWPNAVTWVPSTEDAAADQLLFGGTLFECQEIPPSAEVNTPRPDAIPVNRRPFTEAFRQETVPPSELLLPQVTPELVETETRPMLFPATRVDPAGEIATLRISAVEKSEFEVQVAPKSIDRYTRLT